MKEYVVVILCTVVVLVAVFHDVIMDEIVSLLYSVDLSNAFYAGIAFMLFLGVALFIRAVWLFVRSLLDGMDTDIF